MSSGDDIDQKIQRLVIEIQNEKDSRKRKLLSAKLQRLKFPEKFRNRYNKWSIENPIKSKKSHNNSRLKIKFGITSEDKDNLIIAQNYNCGLCHKPLSNNPFDRVIDHCHKTGKIRSILHGLCNIVLGQCNDNVEYLELAIDYLKRHGKYCSNYNRFQLEVICQNDSWNKEADFPSFESAKGFSKLIQQKKKKGDWKYQQITKMRIIKLISEESI